MMENEKTIARNLYRVLREFEEEDVEEIYSESFAAQGIGKAIMNRLEKAAGHTRLSAAEIATRPEPEMPVSLPIIGSNFIDLSISWVK